MALEMQLLQAELIDRHFNSLLELSQDAFGKIKPEYLRWRVQNQPDLTIFVASLDHRLVGFKAGYAMTNDRYYSWLGGVAFAHRHKGIATKLMIEQHNWLKNSQYHLVETHVRQENSAMIELNLKHGFKITGMFLKLADANYIMQLEVGDQHDT